MESSVRDQHGHVGGQKKVFHGAAGRDNQPKRRQDADQTVFRIYKGVKTFDFSREKNVIVTGGEIIYIIDTVRRICYHVNAVSSKNYL